jgi:hypothetical protein
VPFRCLGRSPHSEAIITWPTTIRQSSKDRRVPDSWALQKQPITDVSKLRRVATYGWETLNNSRPLYPHTRVICPQMSLHINCVFPTWDGGGGTGPRSSANLMISGGPGVRKSILLFSAGIINWKPTGPADTHALEKHISGKSREIARGRQNFKVCCIAHTSVHILAYQKQLCVSDKSSV